VAAPEPPPPAPPPPPIIIQESRYVADLWPRATGGRAFTEDIADGWFGRIEMDVSYAEESWGPGFIGGTTIGLEGWGSSDGGGGGVPLGNYAGFRAPLVISLIGVGVDLLIWDYVQDDGGFGIFAPFGMASIGVDLDVFRVSADMRAQYRWQWGADDRWQIRAGLSVAMRVTD
jgi:hypothetical protein